MPSDIGMMNEAEDVSATVTGFGAAPNCHFRLLNVNEHKVSAHNTSRDFLFMISYGLGHPPRLICA
jgi:hypothetical protein